MPHPPSTALAILLRSIENRLADCRERAARDLRSACVAVTETASKARDYALELRRAIQKTSVTDEFMVGQGSRDMSEVMEEYLHRVDRATAAQENAARRITDNSSSILDLLKELQVVVNSSKLVTLNAAVWSERFDARGPLGLLVDQMERLNRDVNHEAMSIAKVATELLSLLPSLVESISRLRAVSLEFITDSKIQGEEVARGVAQLRERADTIGQNGARRAIEVTRAAEEASHQLDCQPIFDRCFQKLEHVVERIGTYLEQRLEEPFDEKGRTRRQDFCSARGEDRCPRKS